MADEEQVALLKRDVGEWNWFVEKLRTADEAWCTDHFHTNLFSANLFSADLADALLSNADLSIADLSIADLRNADLRNANLNEATLSFADLSGADLSGANLSEADLRSANLSGANLSGANLSGANLSRAYLMRTAVTRATLFGSMVTGAKLWDTVLAGVDLSSTNGLASVAHSGPSHLDNRTLILSKGRIPDIFLKGCGFADWEVAHARLYDPDLTEAKRVEIHYQVIELQAQAPIQPNPVFISYTHADSPFVDRLQEALDEKGVRSWRDIHNAEAGPLDKVIDRAITLNPTMVLVLSEASATSDWVAWEIDKAIELEKKLKRPVLCPIALDSSWSEWLSAPHQARLKRYTVLDYSGEDAVEEMMPRLLKGLRIHYRGEAAPG